MGMKRTLRHLSAERPDRSEHQRHQDPYRRGDTQTGPLTAVPDATGRTAYRIVEEGLTNARKLALGRGRSNAEISAELFMSVATVKAHVSRLLTKLELNNRVQIALLVHDAGLV
jgi:ATP/maltotriose-dependent transcriptional regulator MalT